MRLQVLHQTSDDLVGVRDFAVVGRQTRLEMLGVWRARLVEVQEKKHARGPGGGEPAFRDGFRLGAVAPQRAGVLGEADTMPRWGDIGVEEVEATGDAGFAAKESGRDRRAGPVAAIVQKLRQQALGGVERNALVADACFERQPAGEHRDVGGQGLRRVRVRAFEQHAVGRERVERRRLDRSVSVQWKVVGSQRVDRNENDRTVDRRRCPRVAPSANRRERRRQCGQDEDERVAERPGHGVPLPTTIS